MPRRGIAVVLVLGLVLAFVPMGVASGATGWATSTLVTVTEPIDRLQISGKRVVWVQGTEGEIYTRVIDGAPAFNVSNRPGAFDVEPAVSGDRVAWIGQTNMGRDVFTWAPTSLGPTQITFDGLRADQHVRVTGNRLFWSGANELAEPDHEIYTWAVGDVAPTNISNNPGSAVNDEHVQVSGDRIVWVGRDPVGLDYDVYTWAVSDPVKVNLSDNAVDDQNPAISGNRVVWENSAGGDWDVYTRVVGDTGPVNIGRDGLDDYGAAVEGDSIVWGGDVGGDVHDIFMLTIGDSAPTNLSNTPSVYDSGAVIASGRVAWVAEAVGGGEVYAWTLGGVVNISNNATSDYGVVASADGIAWVNNDSGTYSIRVAEWFAGVDYVEVAGVNRISTAIEASKLAFADDSIDTVVIATAMNWPDALGGAALAGAIDGPILLTMPTTLPAEVSAEITRLGANHAYILGGPSAVGAGVETALKSKLGAGNVKRLAGAGRYETARLIAAETVSALGASYDGTAFLATGANFPDALGASPLAAANGWPIYLVNPATGADAALKGALATDGADEVIVLGGTGVISNAVKDGLGVKKTIRLSGDNRYDTARVVAGYGISDGGLSWDGVAIATGENFPDALAGGVLQGRSGSVLLLTPSKSLNPGVAGVLTANKAVIGEVRFLGGEGAVSTAVRTVVKSALN